MAHHHHHTQPRSGFGASTAPTVQPWRPAFSLGPAEPRPTTRNPFIDENLFTQRPRITDPLTASSTGPPLNPPSLSTKPTSFALDGSFHRADLAFKNEPPLFSGLGSGTGTLDEPSLLFRSHDEEGDDLGLNDAPFDLALDIGRNPAPDSAPSAAVTEPVSTSAAGKRPATSPHTPLPPRPYTDNVSGTPPRFHTPRNHHIRAVGSSSNLRGTSPAIPRPHLRSPASFNLDDASEPEASPSFRRVSKQRVTPDFPTGPVNTTETLWPALVPDTGSEDEFDPALDIGTIITEAELLATREKMGLAGSARQREILEGYLHELLTANQSAPQAADDEPAVYIGKEITVLVNFYIMGKGELQVYPDKLRWRGRVLSFGSPTTAGSGPISEAESSIPASPQFSAESDDPLSSQPAHLVWPLARFGAIRCKHLSEAESLIMLSLDDQLGLQLMLDGNTPNQSDEADRLASLLTSSCQRPRPLLSPVDRSRPTTPAAIKRSPAPLTTYRSPADTGRSLADLEARLSRHPDFQQRLHALQKNRNDQIEAAQRHYCEEVRRLSRTMLSSTGTRFLALQRLGSDSPGSPRAREIPECTLCYTAVQTHIIRPCGHLLCRGCADRIQSMSAKQCPWDRNPYDMIEPRTPETPTT